MDIPLNLNSASEDLYPSTEEGQRDLLTWVLKAFTDAESAKTGHMARWRRFYKMYRSYVPKRKQGEWRSNVWFPLSFYLIETILPKLVAQMPRFNVYPEGPEDEAGAEQMETLLSWAIDRSEAYLPLVEGFKSALMYGTGILKTAYEEKTSYRMTRQSVMEPILQQINTGVTDFTGREVMGERQVGERPTGEWEMAREEFINYAGPTVECVDIAQFFPSPEAATIDDASYVIHQVFRNREHIEKMAKMGIYKLPAGEEWSAFLTNYDYPMAERLASVGLSPSGTVNTEGLIEILELWTDEVVVAVVGRRLVVRAEKNPYAHAQKPFIRLVDHLVPHEFWGIGELEPEEGIQHTLNALWNGRIDNVKLTMNKMYAVSTNYIKDMKDLSSRPGGVIRVEDGMPVNDVVKEINLGDATAGSYQEAAEVERISEKVSGVSAYQMGLDTSSNLNRTATGVALISEQGNTRFSLKLKVSEITGLKKLAYQYGCILQQFMPEEMQIRLIGEDGQAAFVPITAESIQGAFDYRIESESSAQTETVRREQTLALYNMLAGNPIVDQQELVEDVLRSFGRKDTERYIATPMPMAGPSPLAEGTPPQNGNQEIPPEILQQMMAG
jgi:hypothetical protein